MIRWTRRLSPVAVFPCLLLAACASAGPKRQAENREAQKRYRIAQVQFGQGNNQEAITQLKKCVELEPKDADAHSFLGVIYFQVGEIGSAERELETALELNPYLTETRNWLGVVNMKAGRPQRARSLFVEALKDRTYPNPEKILYNLGSLQLEEKNYPEALASFRKAVSANPAYARGYYGLGLALAGSGRREDARKNFRKVISLDPTSPEAARARELLSEARTDKKG